MSNASDLDHTLREFGPMLARIAASYEADPAWREDLLQEISLALWKALPSFRGDAGLRTFIARIAHNRAVDHVLHQKRNRERISLDENITGPPAQRAADQLDLQMDLATAMRALQLNYRQPMSLMLEGFKQAEIAAILGLEENTVAQRLGRARNKLKQLLEPEARHEP